MLLTGNCLKFSLASSQRAGRTVVSTATDNFSIIQWVNLISTPAGATKFVTFNNGETSGNGYIFQINDSRVFSFDISFVANLSSGVTLSLDTWYQLAVIRDSGTAQCYIDAVAQGGTSSSTPNAPQNFVTVGASQVSGGTAQNFSDAYIDDTRFYNRAISTSELTQLYNFQLDPVNYSDISNTSLMSWWAVDESTGTNCADKSASNAPLTTTNSPVFVTGHVIKGIETKRLSNNLRPNIFAPGLAR